MEYIFYYLSIGIIYSTYKHITLKGKGYGRNEHAFFCTLCIFLWWFFIPLQIYLTIMDNQNGNPRN